MTDQKTDADILAEAREYLEKNGWWQGNMREPDGTTVCALGAIIFSQGWVSSMEEDIAPEHMEDCIQLSNKIIEAAGAPHSLISNELYALTSWNDTPERTEQEVLDAFMKAEKTERGGEVDPDA